jgi:hypothetical protein
LRSRENKFLRTQLHARNSKNKYAAGVSQPTPDEQLVRLEEDIRRLRIEFDIFLNGAAKRPPYDTKGRVETLIKRLGDDRTLTYAQRFKYNSLNARYNAFRDLWRRIMQRREEGRDQNQIQRVSLKEEVGSPIQSGSFVCSDANREVETVRNLYQLLIEAKANCGESTDDLSFPRFHRLIASKADGLKEKFSCEKVEFSVAVENGRVSFKARADRSE